MHQSPSAEEVRQRMRAIRVNLAPEVDEIVSNAGQLVDWRYYVKSFPWGSLAAAAALGYLAVSRKTEISGPDQAAIENLARNNQLLTKHTPKAASRPGVVETALSVMGGLLLRAGLAYLGKQVGHYFGEGAAHSPSETADVESP